MHPNHYVSEQQRPHPTLRVVDYVWKEHGGGACDLREHPPHIVVAPCDLLFCEVEIGQVEEFAMGPNVRVVLGPC